MTFLKWAGGKQQLTPKLLELLPPDIQSRRYLEPFVGGGALFFALMPKAAVLSDANLALIMAYHHVKDSPDELIALLREWRRADYNVMRAYYCEAAREGKVETVAQSARFIWLNKMCFNGLYRVNKAGEFNTPKGDRKELPVMDDVIDFTSVALEYVELHIAGYEDVVNLATTTDFVYFDPPYLGDFNAYTANKFDFGEWCRLRWVCNVLDKKKVPWMLSSNDDVRIKSLFEDYGITRVEAKRSINSDGTGRGTVPELVIRNY